MIEACAIKKTESSDHGSTLDGEQLHSTTDRPSEAAIGPAHSTEDFPSGSEPSKNAYSSEVKKHLLRLNDLIIAQRTRDSMATYFTGDGPI